MIKCNRCGKQITIEAAEFCWYCEGYLCYDCFEAFGHCGHKEAEERVSKAKGIIRVWIEKDWFADTQNSASWSIGSGTLTIVYYVGDSTRRKTFKKWCYAEWVENA